MPSVCIYFQVHQPFRLIGKSSSFFSGANFKNSVDKEILDRVCQKSYLPTSKLLLKLANKHKDFRFSISFSGVWLEQIEKFSPEILKIFQKLHQTGKMEILSETYYHSLAFFYSQSEFEKQVELHRKKIKKLFKVEPKVFRNTELAYNNKLGQWADKKGYKGILAEGWEDYLDQSGSNFLYKPKGTKNIKALLRNYKLSDDIAFRFSERSWSDWPLNASKFTSWLLESVGETINIFIDFETFGEHQWKETGIFHFLEDLPKEILKKSNLTFKTASETVDGLEARFELNVPKVLTWADTERDLSAWIGNRMQQGALKKLYSMEKYIIESGSKKALNNWRKLQISDHFYYMSTKQLEDGGIHQYFSPFDSPKYAYENFINFLRDFKNRIKYKD